MFKKLSFIMAVLMLTLVSGVNAQVTTSSMGV